jgi:hypothetical protein
VRCRDAARAWPYPALVTMEHLFAKFRLRTGDGLTFSGLLLLPYKLSKGENAIKCYSPVPRRRGQTTAPPERNEISQPTRNARVRHGSPGGAGQAYLIGFVLAVTVISVLADRRNYLEISRRTRCLSQGTFIKLESEWDCNERRYWRPTKTVISSVRTVIDAGEMRRIVRKRLFRAVAGGAGREWEIDLGGWVSAAREPRGE